MLCGGALFIHMTRRVVTQKSNCISRGDCSTIWACTIRTFPIFEPDFRYRKQWISEKCCSQVASIFSKNIPWTYHVWALWINKVIRGHATVVHDTEILKTRNFRKCWSWWTVSAANMLKFSRWREFQCFAAARFSFTWLVEWLHRRVIASAGSIARRFGLVQSVRFRSLNRISDIENNESRKSS